MTSDHQKQSEKKTYSFSPFIFLYMTAKIYVIVGSGELDPSKIVFWFYFTPTVYSTRG